MGTRVPGNRGPEQLAFDFLRPPLPESKRTFDNLYFAVLPEPEVAQRMMEVAVELRDRHRLPGRVQPAHLLHISLAHVGSYTSLPPHVAAAARQAGSMIRVPPFEVSFDRAMGLKTKSRHFVLRCNRGEGEFEELRRAIAVAMLHTGLRADPSIGLTPHVTLIYWGAPVPETPLRTPFTWTVRELVLVHSLYGRGQHVHLGRWRLAG